MGVVIDPKSLILDVPVFATAVNFNSPRKTLSKSRISIRHNTYPALT